MKVTFVVLAALVGGSVVALMDIRKANQQDSALAYLREIAAAEDRFCKPDSLESGRFAKLAELAPLLSARPDETGQVGAYRFKIEVDSHMNGTPDRRGYWAAYAWPVGGGLTFYLDCFSRFRAANKRVLDDSGTHLLSVSEEATAWVEMDPPKK